MNRRRRKKNTSLLPVIAVLVVILVGLLIVAGSLDRESNDPTLQTPPVTTQPSESVTVPSTGVTSVPTTVPSVPVITEPTEPPIIKEATATLGATGDVLMHGNVIDSGYHSSTDSYDFHKIFTYIAPYAEAMDYTAANLEVTLCGSDNGYIYQGYPNFNSPDAIVEALKSSGFDMLLTANNHSYDTRSVGFHRTQKVIADLGLDHIGTRPSQEDDRYIIRDLNGIRVGMICYTYNTSLSSDGKISLNTIPLTLENSNLVNSFSYDHLDLFYNELGMQLEAMEDAGAEATVLFIHWGNEYQLSPNSTQKKMAQALCDMGIDVIIGGHPHVIQPMTLLTNSNDPEQKTVCLYSTGNAVSNQRLGLISSISTAHTEDGLLFGVTFAKYSDGTVLIESVEILPTWVNMNSNAGYKVYSIVPLDTHVSDWKTAFGLTDSQFESCQDSYDRTMALVGDGLKEVNDWCLQHQAEVEASLGFR